jgi:uncharacterized membrane protein YccF (DUF307 family)
LAFFFIWKFVDSFFGFVLIEFWLCVVSCVTGTAAKVTPVLEPISLLSRCPIPSWPGDGKSVCGGKLNAIVMKEKKRKKGKELLLTR